VKRIRVALVDLQPRLRDIVVDAVGDAPDLELVSPEPLAEAALRGAGADVVVAGAGDPADRQLPERLLAMLPQIRVLMVAASGRTAAMWELRPHRTLHRSITRSGLLDAIRYGVHGREDG